MKTKTIPAYYVYTLAHPDGTVFYVGKGTKDRIGDHQRNARKGWQSYTCNTIRKIWSADCQVLQTKVAFFEKEDEAYQFEMHLIAFFGRENLTNLTDGGEGGGGRPRVHGPRAELHIKVPEEVYRYIMEKVGNMNAWIVRAIEKEIERENEEQDNGRDEV